MCAGRSHQSVASAPGGAGRAGVVTGVTPSAGSADAEMVVVEEVRVGWMPEGYL
jgi:hypothetical protein